MKISICLNSYIGLALHEINHPAITICSQGMNEEDLNEAIKNQFERFVLEAKSKNITGQNYRIKRSTGSIFNATIFWKEYVQIYYPGSKITPNSLINALIASNPDNVLRSKVLTNENSVCTNGIDCSSPLESCKQVSTPIGTRIKSLLSDLVRHNFCHDIHIELFSKLK